MTTTFGCFVPPAPRAHQFRAPVFHAPIRSLPPLRHHTPHDHRPSLPRCTTSLPDPSSSTPPSTPSTPENLHPELSDSPLPPRDTTPGTPPPLDRATIIPRLRRLKSALATAVATERFADAALFRDSIVALRARDPYLAALDKLKDAVKAERFMEAAAFRDEMLRVGAPPDYDESEDENDQNFDPNARPAKPKTTAAGAPKPAPGTNAPPKPSSTARRPEPDTPGVDVIRGLNPESVSTTSVTTTSGVTIRVESYFDDQQSDPARGYFFFGYKVHIVNNSSETIQIVSREWNIDLLGANGKTVKVVGPGLVGKQPVLAPRETFDYTSGCPVTVQIERGLRPRVMGSMAGKFIAVAGDVGEISLDLNIDEFYFVLPGLGMKQ